MTCGFTTDHCLGVSDSSVCCDRGFNYPELYNFNEVDTGLHQCCYAGIGNTVGHSCTGGDLRSEKALGNWCGFGCGECDDGGVDGFGLDQYEFIDGKRWLMPVDRTGYRPWDARGLIHDLRSNEYHPIPGRITYERGTCWKNDGTECFGADICACFGANTISPWFDHDDHCGGVQAGQPLTALLPDEFFRTGYRWPPTSFVGRQQANEQWHCRKFGETRRPVEEGGNYRSTVIVVPTGSDGLEGVTEGLLDPVLLSSNACQSDKMADCTGTLAVGSECYIHSAYGICVGACLEPTPTCEDQCAHTFYAGQHVAGQFNYLDINVDTSDPPHIVSSGDDESIFGRNSAAWKNTILQAVRTQEFPESLEEGGAQRMTRFDRLDHQAHILHPNTDVGLYRREWVGTRNTAVQVPGGSGVGRLRQAGCAFAYTTYITRVKIVCRLILQQHRPRSREGGWLNPLVRLHIIATTTITVSAPVDDQVAGTAGSVPGLFPLCDFVSSKDGSSVNLAVANEWDSSTGENTYVLYGRGQPINYDESFMFFDADGRQFIPSQFVDWRGFLGGHSKPTSEEQLPYWSSDCAEIAQGFRAIVPGWPTHVDTPGGPDGDDPAGMYGGHVRVEFSEFDE